MKKFLVCLCLGINIPLPLEAQNTNWKLLDIYFDAIEQNERCMLSLAVLKNGELVYERSTGFAYLEPSTKANSQTIYGIGSISKSFTAALCLKFIDQGLLKWETPLSTFFPQLPNADKIEIEHLLKHRSGLVNFTDQPAYALWLHLPQSREQMLKLFAENGTEFEPNSQEEYSNTNYVLLSYILEEVGGKPFGQLLEENVLKPLGLSNTYFRSEGEKRLNEAASFQYTNNWSSATVTHPSIPMGAGAIVSTAADVALFFRKLLNGEVLQDQTLNRMMLSEGRLSAGLFQFPYDTHRAWGHTGGIDGFASMAGYFKEADLGFCILSNGSRMPLNDVALAVLQLAFDDKTPEIPDFSEMLLSSEELDKYAGTYSSTSFPLKLVVSYEKGRLITQASGQAPITMEAKGQGVFIYTQAGIKLTFNTENKALVLEQAGAKFNFTKE